jgi:hypothetical protein
MDVMCLDVLCLTDVLSLQMFCPTGRLVPSNVFFFLDVLSLDVLSGHWIAYRIMSGSGGGGII